ncbi:MAG: class I mannose-6-phosphate isomerase [Bacteroidetes bacterium]|nr:class I mannose-6-phosphate isomerase [Bacteroidota bacterium]
MPLRKTAQFLMPNTVNALPDQAGYNIYPVFNVGGERIHNDYGSLAKWIIKHKNVMIDGYTGVFWHIVKNELEKCFAELNLNVKWINAGDFLKKEDEIDQLIAPFLGPADSVWGTKCLLTLADVFDAPAISRLSPDSGCDVNIVYGTGAALADWKTPVIYIDLPKNELQFRMRAGSIRNIGSSQLYEPFQMYKRYYFVDWVLCNDHKQQLLNRIGIVADGQWPTAISWIKKEHLLDGLAKMASSVIRVRPWFEPGAWGGQWIKEKISGINKNVVNYAWSFELIVPENGIVLESDGNLLEISFDFLMFCNREQVMGKNAARFGNEFPIRFDFLDTVKGGNLSIQCHPRLQYIREQFGESFTQDETYYILDCEKEAGVYLGFQGDIDPAAYRQALEDSQANNVEVKITDFVQYHPAQKHDLFLIPHGTVHSAGAGNLVLEISATPYIFTFKMYDWLRLDLDGNPRPINIEHAFNNLDFERKGAKVKDELISKAVVLDYAQDMRLVHLPTHNDHFYDVHRLEFDGTVSLSTDRSCLVMMLVEGEAILVETQNGFKQRFAYAETFVIPAAAESLTITNLGNTRAKVIKAFIKDDL